MNRDPLREPLRGVVAFNPDLLSKEELIAGFIAREELLNRLLDDLRREPPDNAPQHHLILGQRGMGKTTLLHRLRYAIEDDPALATVWLPLTFPEEQYNVAGLTDFWRNCLDAFCAIYEERDQQTELQALEERCDNLPRSDGEAALQLLLSEAERLGRRLALLVDNVDMVLSRIDENQEWAFRRLLSTEPRLLLVGASSRMLESFYDYGKPFYEFFKLHELGPLSDKEMFKVLETLADRLEKPQVASLVKHEPGRLRALRELTGGNPRTVLLLFHLLAQGADGDVRSDLERLLDLNTPLYKARLEELPPQAQRVISALALHWMPATAAVLARKLNLEVNPISAQLSRLEDLGLVEKTPYPGKKAAFQIAERFFNIWYLMRASRRPRRNLIWLARFLQAFYTETELQTRAEQLLQQGCSSGDLRHTQEVQRYPEAEAAYRRAIELDPNDAHSWLGLGDVLEQHYHQPEKAIEAYCKAIMLDLGEDQSYAWWRLFETLWEYASVLELPNVQTDWEQKLTPEKRATLSSWTIYWKIKSHTPQEALTFAKNAACLLPKEQWPKAMETWALLRKGAWPDALEHLRALFTEDEMPAIDVRWKQALAEAIGQDHGAELCKLMEDSGAHERMRPLYAALQVATLRDPTHLLRQPPEVRHVAEQILHDLALEPM